MNATDYIAKNELTQAIKNSEKSLKKFMAEQTETILVAMGSMFLDVKSEISDIKSRLSEIESRLTALEDNLNAINKRDLEDSDMFSSELVELKAELKVVLKRIAILESRK